MKPKIRKALGKIPSLIIFLSSISFTGIFAILSKFIAFFNKLIKYDIRIPLIVLIAIIPIFIYLIIMSVVQCANNIRKPEYLKFSSMEYKDWTLKWEYRYIPRNKRYIIIKIKSVCKKCGCGLSPNINGGIISGSHCSICNGKYPYFNKDKYTIDEVKNIIDYTIHIGSYSEYSV